MKVYLIITEITLTDIWLELKNHVIANDSNHALDLVHNMLPKEYLKDVTASYVKEEIMEI
jgi:hypothetical protein